MQFPHILLAWFSLVAGVGVYIPIIVGRAHLDYYVGPQPRAGVDLPPPGGSTLFKPLHATVTTTTEILGHRPEKKITLWL